MATRKFLSQNPLNAFKAVWWILWGRAHYKKQLANHVTLDPKTLAYRESLVKYLKREKGKRPLYLVTATDHKFAAAIADHLKLFDGVEASNGCTNLRERAKAKRLCELFGAGKFIYIGNSFDDLAVWADSAEVWVCSNNTKLLIQVDILGKPQRQFD